MKKYIDIPQSFDELTNEQFDFIAKHVVKLINGKIKYNHFRYAILLKLLGYTPFTIRIKQVFDSMSTKYMKLYALACVS